MIKRISLLLKSVAKVEITHGDLKITNILVNSAEQPVLIDLDGATEHISLSGLRTAWQKELARFLLNFNSNPVLRKKFEAELKQW
jgi:RIO-like serine/threonine protein kinase